MELDPDDGMFRGQTMKSRIQSSKKPIPDNTPVRTRSAFGMYVAIMYFFFTPYELRILSLVLKSVYWIQRGIRLLTQDLCEFHWFLCRFETSLTRQASSKKKKITSVSNENSDHDVWVAVDRNTSLSLMRFFSNFASFKTPKHALYVFSYSPAMASSLIRPAELQGLYELLSWMWLTSLINSKPFD